MKYNFIAHSPSAQYITIINDQITLMQVLNLLLYIMKQSNPIANTFSLFTLNRNRLSETNETQCPNPLEVRQFYSMFGVNVQKHYSDESFYSVSGISIAFE